MPSTKGADEARCPARLHRLYWGRPLEPSVHRLRLPVGSRAGGYQHGGSLSGLSQPQYRKY